MVISYHPRPELVRVQPFTTNQLNFKEARMRTTFSAAGKRSTLFGVVVFNG